MFDFDPRILVIVILPLAGIILGGMIAITAMHFHNRRREMWHETARLALEKGQPLPPLMAEHDTDSPRASHRSNGRNDVRAGLVLIAVGVGLSIFFMGIRARPLAGVGAIPGLIGVALLLYALFAHVFSSTKHTRAGDQPKP